MATIQVGKWAIPVTRLTKEQAAIIGCYTGFTAGNFADIQELGDKLMDRPTWTHEYANKEFADEIARRAKPLYLAICHE